MPSLAQKLGLAAGFLLLAGALWIALGLGGSTRPPQSNRLTICTALFPLHDWARNVAGPDAEVTLLSGGSADPHQFSLNPQDLARLARSCVLITIGLGFDPWAKRAVADAGDQMECWEVGGWVKTRSLGWEELQAHAHEEAEHAAEASPAEFLHADPHVWLDPDRAARIVLRLGEECARLDPAHATGYRGRAQSYAQELQRCSDELNARSRAWAGKSILTLHDGYGYLLDRCGLKLAGVVQVSPGIEPSARDVAEAVRRLREIGQKVVFSEPGKDRAAQAVADQIGARVVLLDPLESPSPSEDRTYLVRLRYDIQVLAENFP